MAPRWSSERGARLAADDVAAEERAQRVGLEQTLRDEQYLLCVVAVELSDAVCPGMWSMSPRRTILWHRGLVQSPRVSGSGNVSS